MPEQSWRVDQGFPEIYVYIIDVIRHWVY